MAGEVDSIPDTQNDNVKPVQFDNILNFRDVGKTINQYLGKQCVAEGRFFRSGRPDDASLSDRKRLQEEHGIKTIMDLRTTTEHKQQAQKREADLQAAERLQANDALSQPAKITGINYLEINVNGPGFERGLLWQLSTWNITKMLALMAFGYRLEAISILGKNVMLPHGLVGLGYDSLKYCGREIAEALRAFLDPGSYGILVHCTQGKDRTGLIACLILLLLEVPLEAITYDYRLSEDELLPEREARVKEMATIGLTEEFAGCPVDWIEKMDVYLREKDGGVKGYLKGIGFGEEEQAELLRVLRA